MNITDPNEPYFKNGTWGWDGAAWHRLPMVWGYSAIYSEPHSVDNVPAGAYTINFSAVPAGEIWVINNFTAYCSQALASGTSIWAIVGGTPILLDWVLPTAAIQVVKFQGSIALDPDDFLRATFHGCALNDDVRAWACGYKMLITE